MPGAYCGGELVPSVPIAFVQRTHPRSDWLLRREDAAQLAADELRRRGQHGVQAVIETGADWVQEQRSGGSGRDELEQQASDPRQPRAELAAPAVKDRVAALQGRERHAQLR